MSTICFKKNSSLWSAGKLLVAIVTLFTLSALALPQTAYSAYEPLKQTISDLSSLGDRSFGSEGEKKAADYIEAKFKELGNVKVGKHLFLAPTMVNSEAELTVGKIGRKIPIRSAKFNAVSPPATPEKGLSGPIIYVGKGKLVDFNGLPIKNAIVLMDIDSGKNWLNAASLGASALIYIDSGPTMKGFFEEKLELSPLDFPRYYMTAADAKKNLGISTDAPQKLIADYATVKSSAKWKRITAENIYCMIEGTDPKLAEELVIIESFYDSSSYIMGNSPGADEALSIASLFEIGKKLAANPPKRSILLLATTGHGQSLHGMREFIKAISGKSISLKRIKAKLSTKKNNAAQILEGLEMDNPLATEMAVENPELFDLMYNALKNQIKDEVDIISKRLMQMRMQHDTKKEDIETVDQKRKLLRRISWKTDYSTLPAGEMAALRDLFPKVKDKVYAVKQDIKQQLDSIRSARKLRTTVRSKDPVCLISLHLSSRGEGVGAFGRGWFYDLRPRVNLSRTFAQINDILNDAAPIVEKNIGTSGLFTDTLRPNLSRPWQTWLLDKPQFGSEVATMAGLLSFTFATVNDGRPYWGTPFDTIENINWDGVGKQAELVEGLIRSVSESSEVLTTKSPRKGFALVNGKARFVRQGELFADQPAPDTIFMAFQGNTRFYSLADTEGDFKFTGVASSKLVQSKLIIEGYKYNPNGRIVWAIDKKQTGKSAYRLKMIRLDMETKVVMFGCRQTTLFDLLTPRTFKYMTKVEVLDGARDADPMHYWYSRIDTRSSTIASVFLEPNVPLKMTLSDSVLNRKMILIHSTPADSAGNGYNLKEWPIIPATNHRAAMDMWNLLKPRIENLESHGIINQRIRTLEKQGTEALSKATTAWKDRRYDDFMENSRTAWALASRVYLDVDQTQKDVLVGVLFYIALFIPFAYCMERVLFSFADIHKRILGFLGILMAVIAVIYMVHPAFQLTYSPMVVILAFFILGLSVMVSLIIFFRFEKEMIMLQQRAHKTSTSEISKWKAFTAAFVIGVSNLRRRKIRTFLTCLTLTILTFTIMSFTAVKSLREHTYVLFSDNQPYSGIFMKNIGWKDLPRETLGIVGNDFEENGIVAPRGWLELVDKTISASTPVSLGSKHEEVKGLVGLSYIEPKVSGIDEILISGKWLEPNQTRQIILSKKMADRLGAKAGDELDVWGSQFILVGIFDGKKFTEHTDLDGEPMTPVIFPSAAAQELSEVEADAIESGEDIDTFQGRYTHIPGEVTAIIPYETLMAMGGSLKAIAITPAKGVFSKETINSLVDRYGLPIFSCDTTGTYICQAADTMNYSGVSNILIPLIISALIVLNTMITSVYERKKEIAVYTSIGMAPTHVSYLFIAEAVAFAVISVVAGYLIAQTASGLFAGTPLWAGMTANYSSMAGVAAMILVIAVTLISVIYPSRVAANIAIPDVNRSWKMPESESDSIEATLPFLLKHSEQKDAGGFLLEYLESHTEVSHGLFSTSEIEVNFSNRELPESLKEISEDFPDSIACFQFDVRIWLAPFDFGVKQMIRLEFRPAKEYPQFLEAALIINRESGEIGAWKRLNKDFINAIRKQFLVWRSLDPERQKTFREKIPELMAYGFTGLDLKKTLEDI
ncbi:Peptidase family M28 [Maridesulfovibrio ferrireducens]|uniref:Peptidase family M28 n=1 Tax=Maridesulfovibrio ferrireducens TaxID=246191 RepID=A0A1G9HU85_9BACT|nr:FtsX-like permease family protein [Maridesulfovibrio ferrireducens]SDL16376.1 Peptidase family M28 [Maridesulfovibrio ferrireducens]